MGSTGARVASTWRWRAADPSRSTTARGTRSSRSRAARVGSALTASSPRTVRTSPSRSGIGGGEVIATLPAGAEQVAFDPSGERIATDDLEIWDVASQKKVSLRLPVRPPNVTFAFSPDGTRLAVGSADEVRVFDAQSGAELQVLRDPGVVEFDKLVFSPDGSMLASTSADDGTRVWALDIDDLLADRPPQRDQVAVGRGVSPVPPRRSLLRGLSVGGHGPPRSLGDRGLARRRDLHPALDTKLQASVFYRSVT